MLYTDHLEQAFAALVRAREKLGTEIAAYPTPISGCDAQFSHLLSERQKIGDALAALAAQPFVASPRIMVPGARVESR
jgi:chorismate mutase